MVVASDVHTRTHTRTHTHTHMHTHTVPQIRLSITLSAHDWFLMNFRWMDGWICGLREKDREWKLEIN